ncbi:flagellar basal body P-ring formation chaperone FlgA [Nibricoccus sp. IMCC34717]|uniref:flagellar basal body P-ring formation chaperone FlgA n=1 Tax=Nibricoccus sp. IMCC34717 TaxID=3034021 RepID=UPI00384A9285
MRPLAPFLISLALAAAFLAPVRTAAEAPAASPSSASSASSPSSASSTSSASSNRAAALDSLARQLASYFNAEGTLVLETQKPWNLPATASPIEVVVAEYPKELSPLMIVRLRILSGGELLSEPSLAFRAQLMRDVYVTKSPVERETLFDASLFEIRNVDVLRERDPITTGKLVRDMMLARSLPSGRIVSWSDLAKRPLVRRGEWVEVAASDGSLTIVLRAQALENGALGDYVRVRNMDSRKDFNAIVVADNRAEIKF